MVDDEWRLSFVSDSTLSFESGDEPSPELSRRVVSLFRAIRELNVDGIENLHPAYRGLTVDFDPLVVSPTELKLALSKAMASSVSVALASRRIEISVRYGGQEGPDLEEVALLKGLSVNEVIELHAEPSYVVAFLGFSPGFPYLLGLPQSLHCSRKAVPRAKVPAGSIAIAGNQTGIYPEESPGGWQLIGRTSAILFDPRSETPSLLEPGDIVKFIPERKPR